MPLNAQKFYDVNQTWYSRAKDSDAFAKNSLKYGSNIDLRDSKVPLHWSLTDTCKAVKLDPPINEAYKSNEYMGKWKSFNDYEAQTH